MRTYSRPLILALSLVGIACSTEVEGPEALDELRDGDDPAAPPDGDPLLAPLELEVLLLDGPVEPDARAGLLEGLRDAGARVLVTLPGGVWLTLPLDPATGSQLEVAGHVLERLTTLEQVEERAAQAQAQAQAQGADAETFVIERAASLGDLPVVLDGDGDAGSVGALPDPIDGEAPHALLPADVLGFEGMDPGEADLLPPELGGPGTVDKKGPPARDRGKFLRGDVALRVFFVESTGVGNEDWTMAEYTTERTAYINWLTQLARVAPPTANLVFDYVDFPPTHPFNVIDQEPTDGVNEWEWTSDVLDNLGVPGGSGLIGTFNRIASYEATVRSTTGADHVAVAFVVKDAEEPRSEFNGLPWRDAWPHAFFGSYMVTNSGFAGVTFIHELMHVFHAADEYDGGNFVTPCRAWSPLGHDRAIEAGGTTSNGNHENCNHHADGQECLMGPGSGTAMDPFSRPLLCWYTRAQVGWHDTDGLYVRASYPANIGVVNPSPRVHIAGDHVAGLQDFSYVQSGVTQYGSRRCGVGTGTGFTYSAAPGLTSACANDYSLGANLDGAPADVAWPSGPTYIGGASYDEGRVETRTVTYQRYYCGDGLCDTTETFVSCPADCTCGNGVCEGNEQWWTCPSDCTECGNEICEAGEDEDSCPIDCCVQTGPGPCIQ